MSAGTVVLGVLNGLTIGLLAVGLVLVYKSNRFLNLAHGQLGALSALLVAKSVIDWGWSFWLALVAAIALGTLTGLAVERFAVGPLRRRTSSPIRLLLLSLGISQLLLALTYIPALNPDTTQTTVYPQPFESTLELGGVRLTGMSVLIALLVPLLAGGLAVFMRYSILGKQIRAAANNPDAARLAGVSVERVSALTWALAGTFSAVSAILHAPNQASFNVSALGPSLLLLTLGAAAFGAFVSLPMALAGGLVLGLSRQIVSAVTSSGSQAELAVFVLVLAIIFVRGRAIGRVFASEGAVAEEPPVLRIAASIRDKLVVRRRSQLLGGGALVVAVVVPHLPYFNSSGNRFLLSLVVVYAIVGIALTMLLGWGGQVSLGHFAIVGLGAYLTARWSDDGWSLTAIVLAAGVVGAIASVVVGLPALRIRGLTLAVTTLGLAVVGTEWLFLQSWIGTDQPFGLIVEPVQIAPGLGTPDTSLGIYYVALVLLVLGVATASALRRSNPGRMFLAVRDNERATAAFGYSPATIKLAVLAVSGFFAGVGGFLWAQAWRAISPTHFSANVSIALIAVPVIGGLGSVGGAVAAAALLYGTTFFLGPHADFVFGDLGNNLGFSLFVAGASQVAVLLQLPSGLAGAGQRLWQRFLDRRAEIEARTLAGGDPDLPLAVSDVRVSFGGVVALDHVSVEVGRGEIVGLIGGNGAGKTTLMNVVSGVLRPETGSVRVAGAEIIDLPADYRAPLGLSRSFQDATLFAGLTVAETLQVTIARRHKTGVVSAMVGAPWARATDRRTRQEADALVERFGLGPWADIRASELSTGTRRVCELAAQVAARPDVILLDEPTAGVAQREAEAFGPLLREIRDELDCAVLIVEHDMPLLMGLCDRMYALESGRVIAEGRPDQIRDDPAVIASYLGTETAAIGRSGATAAVPAGSTNGPASSASRPATVPPSPRRPPRSRPLRSTR